MSLSMRMTTLPVVAVIGLFGTAALLVAPLATNNAEAQNLTNPVYHEAKVPSNPMVQSQPQQVAQIPTIQQHHPVRQALAIQPTVGTTAQPAIIQAAAPIRTYDVNPLAGATYDGNIVPASAIGVVSPLNLTQQPGEHPLMPFLRNLSICQQQIDNLQDYSATFTKVERINGTLSKTQQMNIRVRHNPFSIYMKFVQPNPGQEVLYVVNENEGQLVALASGWKRRIGKMNLDPMGSMAMQNQRYPITRAGIQNLTKKLTKIAKDDTKYAECTVTHNAAVKIDSRAVTMIESTHPVPRKNFTYHKARIFIDHELMIPVAYEKYSWPAQTGGRAVLEERYIYTNLQVNNNFADLDFSADNPTMFQ